MPKKTTAHNDYWSKRSADIMRHVDRTDIDMFTELQKIYAEGSAEMQKELFAFVSKYSADGSISYQEALQRLRGVDLSDYQANAEKYRKQAEKDPELLRRLNEQYAASKVTRMDALNLEIAYKLGVMQGVIDKSIGNYFKSVAGYAYKKAMGGNSGAINTPALEELVRTPFYGKNYSERIWGNTDNLANDLRDILKRGFIRGDDVRSMAGELAKKYNVARSRAQTLVRTDGTAIVNRSAIRRYQDAGLEYYRISVQMDNRTSETCKRIYAEDKRYRMDEFSPGVTAPPFHFNCRSAVIPDEEEMNGGTKDETKNNKVFVAENSDEIDEFFKKQKSYRKWYNQIEKKEMSSSKQAIIDYSMSEHETINGILRKGRKVYEQEYVSQVDAIDKEFALKIVNERVQKVEDLTKGIQGFETERGFKTYRGISFWGDDPYANLTEGESVVLDKGFLSTSLDKKQINNFADGGIEYRIEIEVPKGYVGGAYIAELSDIPEEKEFLFQPESKFNILSVKHENNVTKVKAEAIK